MSKLTGNKNVDFMILMQLNDYELGKICQVNKYVNSICNDPQFWLNRIIENYSLSGKDVTKMKDYLGFLSIKELYIYLKSIPVKFRYYHKIHNTEKFIPIIIKYLIEQTFIETIINDNIIDKIPKWFNKDELIYELTDSTGGIQSLA